MSIDLGSKIATVSERTKLITISVAFGQDAEAWADREIVTVDSSNNVLSIEGAPTAVRLYSQIKNTIYTIGEFSLSGEQLYSIISGIVDIWRKEDTTN